MVSHARRFFISDSWSTSLVKLAGSTGLEPAASCVTGRRSRPAELRPQKILLRKILEQLSKLSNKSSIAVYLL